MAQAYLQSLVNPDPFTPGGGPFAMLDQNIQSEIDSDIDKALLGGDLGGLSAAGLPIGGQGGTGVPGEGAMNQPGGGGAGGQPQGAYGSFVGPDQGGESTSGRTYGRRPKP